jgi:hypothetical protein
MAAYLHGPHEDDLTTECGSHMLNDLNKYNNGSSIDSLLERASYLAEDVHEFAD